MMATRKLACAAILPALAIVLGAHGAARQITPSPMALAPAVAVSMTAELTSLAVVDDSHVAAGLADGRVAIWNGRDSTTIDVPAHKAKVLAVGATTDGQRGLSVASDGSLAESPVAKGPAGRTRHIDLGPAPTRAALFSTDGARLPTGGRYADVFVYDVESA